MLLGGLIGFAVASAAFVAVSEPDFLGVARLAQGASAAAFSPAAAALVAAAGAGGQGRSFGGYGAAKGLGYLAGPIGGGLLVAAGGCRLLFTALAVLAVVVAGWVAKASPPSPSHPAHGGQLIGLARRLGQGRFLRPVVVLAAAAAAFS